MASHLERDGPTKSHRSSLRKSIAHLPSPTFGVEDNKENLTADVGAMTRMKRASTHSHGPATKKSRSKSIGPGGLDAFKAAPKAQRTGSSTGLPIKSILKPTIPLSPLREIPSHRVASTSRKTSVAGWASLSGISKPSANEDLLIDISDNDDPGRAPISVSGAETLQNPFDVGLDLQLQRTSEVPVSRMSPDVHVSDDKEKEQREKERKEILERREARRKSLANRRVSFAPEATLHTWNVIEFIQDSTTSTASTSSRGQPSSLPTPAHTPAAEFQPDTPVPGSDVSDAPSTPPHQVEGTKEHLSTLHEGSGSNRRKRRRRSSGATSVSSAGRNEERSLSSPLTGSLAMESEDSYSERVSETDEGDSTNTRSESAEGDSTSMSLDDIDATVQSLISAASSQGSTASTSRLNEALRQAAIQAGTKGIEYDENGDLSMEMAIDQVTAAFQPWSNNRGAAPRALKDLTALQDQENQNPFSPAFQAFVNKGIPDALPSFEDDDEVDMDMTRPVGNILVSQFQQENPSDILKKRPSLSRRLSSGEDSSLGDATMDLTMAIGGIHEEQVLIEVQEDESNGERAVVDTPKNEPEQMQEKVLAHLPTAPIQAAEVMAESSGNVKPSSKNAAQRKIRLQEFLTLTGIHFMDLTATKRKLRKLSSVGKEMEPAKDGVQGDLELNEGSPTHLEECVKAAACTLPMLELYQHSCRELKKSISEGRSIIRQIETDVSAENPGLFREYLSAAPDVRLIMDNQFKNLKTYARLSSKAIWYDWRKKLLDDLKGGLLKNQDDMNKDEEMLVKYESLLSFISPHLVENHEYLRQERERLQVQADEIARSNQEELGNARSNLMAIRKEIEEKRALVEQKRTQIREKQEAIEVAIENQMTFREEIKEAERIKEECRGWSASEVRLRKDLADHLEQKHGWTIAGIEGTTMTMTFQRELQLSYDISTLTKYMQPGKALEHKEPSLNVSYLEDARAKTPASVQTIKDVFVQSMNKQLVHKQPREPAGIAKLLTFVNESWGKAGVLAEEYRLLNLHFPTEVRRSPEDGLTIKSTLLLPSLRTKLQLAFEVSLFGEESPDVVRVSPRVAIVYGEYLDPSKMQEFLARRVGKSLCASVKDLCGTLSTRGKDVSPVKR
ncbi:MAG: hypothetical protein M1816_001625 [Peltula sp. TS41687]|nr:MAG: hypothetical protein M1816_001625 [Peltula sp. TS41687]